MFGHAFHTFTLFSTWKLSSGALILGKRIFKIPFEFMLCLKELRLKVRCSTCTLLLYVIFFYYNINMINTYIDMVENKYNGKKINLRYNNLKLCDL